jgi:hypothetical protein
MASIAQYTTQLDVREKGVPPSELNWDRSLVEGDLDWTPLLHEAKNIFILGMVLRSARTRTNLQVWAVEVT